jgi:putative methylase
MALSKLIPHPCTDVTLEQYATEGDLAAYWMLAVDQLDGLEGRRVADLGAGNGILGIAALILGAEAVVFVEADENAAAVLQENIEGLGETLSQRATVVSTHIGTEQPNLDQPDLIVMNPPWGVQRAKADRPFLDLAFASGATAIHVLHSDRAVHLEPMAIDAGWESEAVLRTTFRLPPTYAHHAQRQGATDVKCWRFFRHGDARLPLENDE